MCRSERVPPLCQSCSHHPLDRDFNPQHVHPAGEEPGSLPERERGGSRGSDTERGAFPFPGPPASGQPSASPTPASLPRVQRPLGRHPAPAFI